MSNFRKRTQWEDELFVRLLDHEFPGRDELREQLKDAPVRTIDDEGSIEIEKSASSKKAPVSHRIPVEAEGVDRDGVKVHILLHVVNGFAEELEVFKEDASPVGELPPVKSLALSYAAAQMKS